MFFCVKNAIHKLFYKKVQCTDFRIRLGIMIIRDINNLSCKNKTLELI